MVSSSELVLELVLSSKLAISLAVMKLPPSPGTGLKIGDDPGEFISNMGALRPATTVEELDDELMVISFSRSLLISWQWVVMWTFLLYGF